jgi:uncharacterized membrane protein
VKTKTALLAAAAGALFLAASPALADTHEGKDAKVKCEGVNSCKGQSDCHTSHSECSGKNSCKGKGYKKMTAEECAAAKAEMEKESEKEG